MKFQNNLAYLDEKALNSELNRVVNSVWNEECSEQWKKFVSLLTGRVIYLMVLTIEMYCCST